MAEQIDPQSLEFNTDDATALSLEIELVEEQDKVDEKVLHQKLLGYYKEALAKSKPWRDECRTDRNFYENKQWTDDERKLFEAQKRPIVTINEVKRTVDTILGIESRNRMEIKVFPRNSNDISPANARTAWIKYIADQNDLEFQTAAVFKNACTYSHGVWETGYEQRPGREAIYLKSIDPEDFFYDPYSTAWDLDDAQYCGIHKMLDLQKAQILFPDYTDKLKAEVVGALQELQRPTSHQKKASSEYYDFYDFGTTDYKKPTRQQLKVIQIQYKVEEEGFVLVDEYGDIHILDPNEVDEETLELKLEGKEATIEKRLVTRIYQAQITHDHLLTNNPVPYRHGQFNYVVVWGDRYANGEPVSIIRPLRDPQREVNRRRSSAMLEITANQWMMRGQTNENLDKLTKQLGDPFALVKEPMGTRLEKIDRASRSAPNFNYYKEAQTTIRELSGVNDEMRGLGGPYQSGYAIGQKLQQGTTAISALFDNLRRARKQLGYQLLSLADQYLTPAKKQRIIEREGVDYDLREEDKFMFYDIIPEEIPQIATDRQSQLMSLSQVMSSMQPEVQAQLLPGWLSLYDLPQMDEMVKAAQRVADVMVANLEAQAMQAKMSVQQMQNPPQPPQQGQPPQGPQEIDPNQAPPQEEPTLDDIRQALSEQGRDDLASLSDEELLPMLQQMGLM